MWPWIIIDVGLNMIIHIQTINFHIILLDCMVRKISTLLLYLTLHSWLGQKGCLEFHDDDDYGDIIIHGQIFVISTSTQTKQKNGGWYNFAQN